MKTVFPGLCNHLFHPVAKQACGNGFIKFYIVKRNIAKGAFAPVATMRHSEFIPSTIAPHSMHGVYHFNGRNIFIQQKIAVIRCSYLPLFIIGAGFIIYVNNFVII